VIHPKYVVILMTSFIISCSKPEPEPVPILSWTQIPFPNGKISSFNISGNTIYLGTQQGEIYNSDAENINWINLNTASTLPIHALAIDNTTIYGLAGSNQIIYGDNNKWTTHSFTDVQTINALLAVGNNLYVGTEKGLLLSTDQGVSFNWKTVRPADTFIMSLFAFNTNLYAGTFNGTYQSDLTADNWSQVGPLYVFDAFAIKGDSLLAGTSDGLFYVDRNNTWTAEKQVGYQVMSIAVNNNEVYLGTWKGGVYLSLDKENSWTSVNSGFVDLNIFSIHASPQSLFALTSAGLFTTPLK